jgi:hypothetical protein
VEWLRGPSAELPVPTGVRVVRRIGAGEWLLCGDEAMIAICSPSGLKHVVQGPDTSVRFTLASGNPADLAVLVGSAPHAAPALYACSAGRWVKPMGAEGVRRFSAVVSVGDATWLLAGERDDGGPYVATYRPLTWELVERRAAGLEVPLTAGDGNSDAGLGLLCGATGAAAWFDQGELGFFPVAGAPKLTAARVDPLGRGVIGGAGGIWLSGDAARPWIRLWDGDDDAGDVVALHVDDGLVVALFSDGAILEGTTTMVSFRRSDPG